MVKHAFTIIMSIVVNFQNDISFSICFTWLSKWIRLKYRCFSKLSFDKKSWYSFLKFFNHKIQTFNFTFFFKLLDFVHFLGNCEVLNTAQISLTTRYIVINAKRSMASETSALRCEQTGKQKNKPTTYQESQTNSQHTDKFEEGFDEELVIAEPDGCMCALCHLVLRDAIQLDCGDRYCQGCLGRYRNYNG